MYIKIIIAAFILSVIGGGVVYVKNLQATVEVLKANNAKLEGAVEDQKKVIQQQIEDTKKIVAANKELSELNQKINQDVEDLKNKFSKVNASGKRRDIGNLSVQKPALMKKAFNRGTKNALRCVEIATGAKLNEKEQNAEKKSEINPECPSIANPRYIPHSE